jgi:hypothetical protein
MFGNRKRLLSTDFTDEDVDILEREVVVVE